MNSMSAAVISIIDSYPVGYRFFGNELHNDVAAIYPKAQFMYTDTLLRMARRHRRAAFRAANPNKSWTLPHASGQTRIHTRQRPCP